MLSAINELVHFYPTLYISRLIFCLAFIDWHENVFYFFNLTDLRASNVTSIVSVYVTFPIEFCPVHFQTFCPSMFSVILSQKSTLSLRQKCTAPKSLLWSKKSSPRGGLPRRPQNQPRRPLTNPFDFVIKKHHSLNFLLLGGCSSISFFLFMAGWLWHLLINQFEKNGSNLRII